MKRENPTEPMRKTTRSGMKQLGLAFGVVSLLSSASVMAQTPVSASMSMSGSCASCDLSNREMPRTSLQGSNFSNSDFSRSNLSGSQFHNSNLQGASFHKAYLMRVNGTHINLRGAVLRGTTLIEAKLLSSDLSHADLRQADLSDGYFDNSRFVRSNLTSVDAMRTSFVSANFSGAKLHHGDFTGAVFDKAIFIKTKFGDAELGGTRFVDADLSGANLAHALGLTQEQMELACGNEDTKLPEGLHIKTCVYTTPKNIEALVSTPAVPTPATPPITLVTSATGRTLFTVITPKSAPLTEEDKLLNSIMEDIDELLQTLPLDSSSHKTMSETRRKLEKLQRQKQTRIWVKTQQ